MLVVKYKHHGVEVSVGKYLKGKHRDYCLCYLCKKFKPENRNCLHKVTTPVWECKKFIEK